MITLDTSALFALLNEDDPDHKRVVSSFKSRRAPYFVPAGIFAEVAYMVEERLGVKVLDAFLDDLDSGRLSYYCGDKDLSRIRELVVRYSDLPLGAADAAVIACAERNGGEVLTLDRRDFNVVARERTIEVFP